MIDLVKEATKEGSLVTVEKTVVISKTGIVIMEVIENTSLENAEVLLLATIVEKKATYLVIAPNPGSKEICLWLLAITANRPDTWPMNVLMSEWKGLGNNSPEIGTSLNLVTEMIKTIAGIMIVLIVEVTMVAINRGSPEVLLPAIIVEGKAICLVIVLNLVNQENTPIAEKADLAEEPILMTKIDLLHLHFHFLH